VTTSLAERYFVPRFENSIVCLSVVYLMTSVASDCVETNGRMNQKVCCKRLLLSNLRCHLGNFNGGTQENHENPQSSSSSSRDVNPGPPEDEASMLTTELQCSVHYLSVPKKEQVGCLPGTYKGQRDEGQGINPVSIYTEWYREVTNVSV
jgi:hypothetical protein